MINQKGFSLIELMIAMVISLILSAALIVTFMSERTSFSDQQNLSALQENQQMVLSRINDVVAAAGFYADTMHYTLATALPATTITAVGTFSASQSIIGITNSSFAIRYQIQGIYNNASAVTVQTNNGIQDCLGNKSTSASATVVTNVFSFNATTHQLSCTVYSGSTQQTAIVSDGISSMSVLYGYDGTGNGSVTHYYLANAVSDWSAVKSIMITFNFINPNDSSKTFPITAVFVMNNKVK
jgi:type IV pilus assembly protein PilW